MHTFSRFFAISIIMGFLSFGGLLVSAQTSGTGPLLEIPSGELHDMVPVRLITAAVVPGPIRLFLEPSSIFVGDLVRNTDNLSSWEYQWDTRTIPNGSYYLVARTLGGTDIGRPVTIYNAVASAPLENTTLPPPPLPLPPPPSLATPETSTQPPPPLTSTTRPVLVEISQSGIARGTLEIILFVDDTESVELFVGKLSENEGRMVGSATRTTSDPRRWVFHWDSTKHENGVYAISARIKTPDGYFWSRIAEITILNVTPPPPPPKPVNPPPPILGQTATPPPPLPTRIEKKQILPPSEPIHEAPVPVLTNTEEEAIKRRIREDISETTQTIQAIDERPKEILQLPDSDSDGITDYDEKNIYKTNPLLKDSDKDGINDTIELLSNQDPNNAAAANIAYQNPKEAGIPRPEILVVNDIVPVLATNSSGVETISKLTLTGKALPNNLVTLYIFSTPFVVTVKTNADGQWTYTFDKELENGEHIVYATITDSKGSVLAKSNPLSFVKTANAITKTPSITKTDQIKPSIYGKHPTSFIIALIASIIGIALVVIGLVIRHRRAEALLLPQ
jgi:hypothetical protein